MLLLLGVTPLKEYETGHIKFNFTRNDGGWMKCVASNSLGSIEKLVYLAYYGKLRIGRSGNR